MQSTTLSLTSMLPKVLAVLAMLFVYGVIFWLVWSLIRKGGFPGSRELPSEAARGRKMASFKSQAALGDVRYKNASIAFSLYENGILISPAFRRPTWIFKDEILELRHTIVRWAEGAVEFQLKDGQSFQIVNFQLELNHVWEWWGKPEESRFQMPDGWRRIF